MIMKFMKGIELEDGFIVVDKVWLLDMLCGLSFVELMLYLGCNCIVRWMMVVVGYLVIEFVCC